MIEMIEMIEMRDQLIETQEDIENLKKLINDKVVIENQNNLTALIKCILLLKQTKLRSPDTYYADCMISDLLLLIYLLTQNHTRIFYMVYRSMVENSIRFLLDLNENDTTSVFKLFKQLQIFCDRNDAIYQFIEQQYSIGCDYTHSNIKANINLCEYYLEIFESDKPTAIEREEFLEILVSYLERLTVLLIEKRSNWIDTAFYKEQQKLKYLLTQENYGNYLLKVQ